VVDFDDQKYIPVILGPNGKGSHIPMNQFDIIFVDEAQDVSAVDLELIRLSLREGGMVVAIGDDKQAIYGFRGADVNSINNIKKTFDAVEKPLSITYRCGRAIVEHLNGIYPGIEAAPNAIEGEVIEHGEFDASMFTHWTAAALPEQRKTIHDMIVCRNNAPLVKMAFRLIRAKRSVHMMGRDFGKDLIALITTLVGDRRDSVEGKTTLDLSEALEQWEARQIAIIKAKDGDDAAVDHITDRADTIRVFITGNVDGKVSTVMVEIADLFNTNAFGNEDDKSTIPTDKIILCSGHKSKGLESERTFVLDSHLLHPVWIKPGSWQDEQETNLEYVICSRAKQHLGFIYTDQMAA
jgi:DNA helicase-2/ATP-dependent DNA helicase PcrA